MENQFQEIVIDFVERYKLLEQKLQELVALS